MVCVWLKRSPLGCAVPACGERGRCRAVLACLPSPGVQRPNKAPARPPPCRCRLCARLPLLHARGQGHGRVARPVAQHPRLRRPHPGEAAGALPPAVSAAVGAATCTGSLTEHAASVVLTDPRPLCLADPPLFRPTPPTQMVKPMERNERYVDAVMTIPKVGAGWGCTRAALRAACSAQGGAAASWAAVQHVPVYIPPALHFDLCVCVCVCVFTAL